MSNRLMTIWKGSVVLALAAATGCGQVASDSDSGPDAGMNNNDNGNGGTAKGVCTTGTLFAGNPLDESEEPADPDGVPLGTAAVGWRDVVFSKNFLFTQNDEEVWYADLSAATPQIKRLIGVNQPGPSQFKDGPCAEARLAYIDGLAILPDGSLLLTDDYANAVVKVTDPTGPTCAVSFYAGTAEDYDALPPDKNPNGGTVDGTGSAAQFSRPMKLVADGDVVYLIDRGNRSIRKIAPGGVVTTVPLKFDRDLNQWNDMTLMGGKLYLIGQANGSNNYIVEVNPNDGAHKVIVEGFGELFDPLPATNEPKLATITTDGSRLFVFGAGFIWQIKLNGTVRRVAGGFTERDMTDFPPLKYDPAVSHPALELALRPKTGAGHFTPNLAYMSYEGDSLYWVGSAGGSTGHYVEKITCPK